MENLPVWPMILSNLGSDTSWCSRMVVIWRDPFIVFNFRKLSFAHWSSITKSPRNSEQPNSFPVEQARTENITVFKNGWFHFPLVDSVDQITVFLKGYK